VKGAGYVWIFEKSEVHGGSDWDCRLYSPDPV
jgi:hypothetical protein